MCSGDADKETNKLIAGLMQSDTAAKEMIKTLADTTGFESDSITDIGEQIILDVMATEDWHEFKQSNSYDRIINDETVQEILGSLYKDIADDLKDKNKKFTMDDKKRFVKAFGKVTPLGVFLYLANMKEKEELLLDVGKSPEFQKLSNCAPINDFKTRRSKSLNKLLEKHPMIKGVNREIKYVALALGLCLAGALLLFAIIVIIKRTCYPNKPFVHNLP